MAAAAAAAVIILLLLAAGSPAEAQTFADVRPSDQFYTAIEALAGQGVIHATPGSNFKPYDPETRAEFAFSVAGLLHLSPATSQPFTDVANSDWFAGAVGALYTAGILMGNGDGTFDPASELSRQQAAALAMRAYAYGPGVAPAPGSELITDPSQIDTWLSGFKDRGAIAPAHREAVANAYRLGVVSGFPDGRFYPFLDLTHAQAAVILYKALVPSAGPRQDPPQAVEPEATYPTAEQGSRGPLIGWMEHELAGLSYLPGPVDGVFDARTADAVMAFQKIEGLERTGTATGAVWSHLVSAERPKPRKNAPGTRVEVDLTRQVLMFIVNNVVDKTIPISTGRSGWHTPTGVFSAQRKLPYWRESSLGLLYKPVYFTGGYAIHGSYSVPAYPASHGCVRVAVTTMDLLYPLIPLGTRVDVYY